MDMRLFYKMITIIVISIIIAACKSGEIQENNNNPSFGLFYDKGDHLTKLLSTGDLDKANSFYNLEERYFIDNFDKHSKLLNQFSLKIRNYIDNDLEIVKNLLIKVNPSELSTNWSQDYRLFDEIQKRINKINEYKIFIHPKLSYKEITQVNTSLVEKIKFYEEIAPSAFTKFNHWASENPFFSIYPTQIRVSSVIYEAQERDLLATMFNNRSSNELYSFYLLYKKLLHNPKLATTLSYLSNRILDLRMSEVSRTKFPTLRDVINVYRELTKEGLQPVRTEVLSIGIINNSISVDTSRKKIEFPIKFEMDTIFKTQQTSYSEAFESHPNKYDYIIIVDVISAITDSLLNERKSISSSLLDGHQTESNERWQHAQIRVQQAESNLRTIENKSCGNNPVLCGMLAGQKVNARSAVSRAYENLYATPQTISKPIYRNYNYQKVSLEVRKQPTIAYYIVSLRQNHFDNSILKKSEINNFDFVFNVNNKDENYQNIINSNSSVSDIEEYVTKPLLVKFESILDDYAKSTTKSRRFTSVSNIKKEISKKRRNVLARSSQSTNNYKNLIAAETRRDSSVNINNKYRTKPRKNLTNSCEDNHWIESVHQNGKIVILEDGSVWEISSLDRINTALWLPITSIVACPNKLINTDDGEKAEAIRIE